MLWKTYFLKFTVFLLIVACTRTYTLQESIATDSTGNNCWAANFVIPPSSKEIWGSELDVAADALVDDMKNNSNVSHLKTSTLVKSWQEKPRLKFPKFTTKERYKMASLHLNKGWFAFNFLRGFFSFIQPYNIPTGKLLQWHIVLYPNFQFYNIPNNNSYELVAKFAVNTFFLQKNFLYKKN